MRNRVLNVMSTDWDDTPPNDEFFEELFRISKNQIIWGGNYFALPRCRCFVCWDKCQPWENFSQVEYAWTSFDKPAKLFRYDNRTSGKIHPTEKPVKLYEWLLLTFAEKDQTILDTHGGSMSSAIAAHKLDFAMTIIEKDPIYYAAARKRLADFQRQLNLFL